MNTNVWIHLRDYFDYHKLIETKNEKLINYSPRHHMSLYLRIILSSEAANLEILGFYTGSKLYFSPSVRVCADLNEDGHGDRHSTLEMKIWRSCVFQIYAFSYRKPTLTKQINHAQFSSTIWFKFICSTASEKIWTRQKRTTNKFSVHVCSVFPLSLAYSNTPKNQQGSWKFEHKKLFW